jgi:hypothetical protein
MIAEDDGGHLKIMPERKEVRGFLNFTICFGFPRIFHALKEANAFRYRRKSI